MADFALDIKVTKNFFDREAVTREIGAANAKALSKIGAFVQRRARSSMRRRKAASAPGTPPSAHAKGFASLKTILFAYDRANMSVVIGPVKLNGSQGSVPALHEFGGAKPVRVVQVRGQWRVLSTVRDVPFLHKLPQKTVAAKYPARPFMGPALAAEAPNFPTLYAMGPARIAA